MKGRAVKLLAGLAVLLAVFALAVPLILARYFPQEKARDFIVSQASKSLGREISLSDVSYSLWKGVTLHKLAVSEVPSFSAGRFLDVDSFHVRVRWLPLLQKRLEIDSVSAEGLKILVKRRPDGTYNFSQLAPAPDTGAGTVGSASAPVLSARRVAIIDGSVEYRDLETKETLVVSAINATVSGFAPRGAFDVDASLSAKGAAGGRPIDGRAAYSGKVDLGGNEPGKFFAEFKKLLVEQQGLTLRASGRLSGLSTTKAEVAFSLAGARGKVIDGSFSGTAVASAGGFDGEIDAKTPGFSGADLAALGVPATLEVPAVKASGTVGWAGGKLTAKKLRAEGAFGSAEISGVARGFDPKRPDADLDFTADLSLPEISEKDYPRLGLPGGASLPPSEVRAKGHLTNDDLRLDSFRLKTARGTIDASGTAKKLLSSKPETALSGTADLSLPAIPAADIPFVKLPEGFVSPAMTVEGSFKVSSDELDLSPLRVKGKSGTVDVSGSIKKLRSEQPEPDLDVKASLDLPALAAKDIPSSAVPADFALPPSKWDAAVSGTLDDVKIKKLRLQVGKNDVEIAEARLSGLRTKTPLFSILVKCRSFALEELKHLTAATKDLDIAGSGFFALEVTGRWPRPILAGKAQFRDLGANVSGLPLSSFTGTASFDERRIEVPNLKGRVADGDLDVNLTINDYAKRPDIDVEASLTRFDLGKFLAAKTAVAQKQTEQTRAESEARHNAEPINVKGRLTVGELVHQNADARDLKLDWRLTGLTPDLRHLSGAATVRSTSGKFSNLGAMASQSKLVKVLVSPLLLFQTIGKIGGIKLFPDFNNVTYSELTGDYSFQNGIMTLNESHVYSDAGNVSATGTIDLPRENLEVTATAQVARLAPLPVVCKGDFDKPNCKAKLSELLTKPLQDTLQRLITH